MAKATKSEVNREAIARLFEDFSLEMTGRDVLHLDEAKHVIPQGTRINVTFLGNEDLAIRRTAAQQVKALGFVPVPHIAARRLKSSSEFDDFLAALHEDGTGGNVFVIAGDPSQAEGPYDSAADLIDSGLLPKWAVKNVGISGYPDGHPEISTSELDAAIVRKATALSTQRLAGQFITQFGFDVDPVLAWVEKIRGQGIDWPIRIGVPGPAGVKRLLGYASRFGITSSAAIAKKYGFSITNLLGTAGPDHFIEALAAAYDPQRHGDVRLHFYTFGGLQTTSQWIADFLKETR